MFSTRSPQGKRKAALQDSYSTVVTWRRVNVAQCSVHLSNRFSENLSDAWDDDAISRATRAVKGAIRKQERKVKEFTTLIEHTKGLASLHIKSRNQGVALIFLKMILQHEEQRNRAVNAIRDLKELLQEVEVSETPVCYEIKIKNIVSTPIVKLRAQKEDKIMCEIQWQRNGSPLQLNASSRAA